MDHKAAYPGGELQTSQQKITLSDSGGGFVAVDVAALSLLAAVGDVVAGSPRISSMQKNLSRKGSQRGGAERSIKSPAAEGDVAVNGAAAASPEKSPLAPRAAAATDGVEVEYAGTPMARGGGGWRRVAGGGGGGSRRGATWLDPRRVLFAFAALSSMGSLLLLYLTLSLDNNAAAWW